MNPVWKVPKNINCIPCTQNSVAKMLLKTQFFVKMYTATAQKANTKLTKSNGLTSKSSPILLTFSLKIFLSSSLVKVSTFVYSISPLMPVEAPKPI